MKTTMKTNRISTSSRLAHVGSRFIVATAAFALSLVASQVSAQTTLSYGDGTNTPAAQLNGNWTDAGRWYNGTSWVNWTDGNVARFYSPAAGTSATLTLTGNVTLNGLTKDAAGGHFTVIAQAGHRLNFANNSTISVNNNTLATQAGTISANNLSLNGTSNGTVRIGPVAGEAGANSINGLTLNDITLQLSKSNDVAAVGGAVVVNSGSLLHGNNVTNRKNNQYAAGSTLTINGGSVTFYQTTQTLDSLTWNGGSTSFTAGAALNLGGNNALTMRGGLTLTNTSVNLTKNGAQTVRFDAANNGTAIISTGTALVMGGGVKTFQVENGTATTDMQVLVTSITETAASSIRKTGGGVVAWNVTGNNTYTNGMSVEEGALFFVSTGALPASGVTVSNGAVLGLRMTSTANGSFTEQNFLDLHAGTLANVTMGTTAYAGWETNTEDTLSAALTGTRGFAKLGGNKLILTGNSNYTGGTLINQGNLQIGNGGTSGSITGNVTMASAADSFRQLIFNRSDALTYDGNISGAGSVRNDGAGILTLTGSHTYNGPTTVAAGGMIINGGTATASAVTVASGAVIGGSGTIGGNLNLQDGALFGFDTTNTAFTLTLNGTLTLDSGFGVASLRNLDGTAIAWDTIALNTTYTLLNTSFTFNGTNITNFGFDNRLTGLAGGREAYFQNGSLQLVVIPEPTTWALLAGSLTALVLLRRRR